MLFDPNTAKLTFRQSRALQWSANNADMRLVERDMCIEPGPSLELTSVYARTEIITY